MTMRKKSLRVNRMVRTAVRQEGGMFARFGNTSGLMSIEREIARLLGISQARVNKIVNGKTT